MGFNGLNRCFDFGLIGPILSDLSDLSDPSRPFRPEAGLLGLSGAVGRVGSPPFKGRASTRGVSCPKSC